MPISSFTFFDSFIENAVEGNINCGSDQFTVALTNSAPTASTDTQLSDITQITYTNLSSRNLTTTSSSQTGGDYSLVLADLTLTASGGSVGPFRYAVIYSDTSTGDLLVGYYDYGSSVTIADGESLDLDLSASGTVTISAA